MELIQSNTQTMSSLEISELVESRHDSVKRTIERLYKSGAISQPPTVFGKKSANGVTPTHYEIGKRDSYVIVAQLSPQFTARLVDRWQELESQQNTPELQMAQGLIAAQQVIEAAHKQIAELKPKAEFYDDVTGSSDTISMAEVAKVLNIKGLGRNKLFQILRDKSILQRDNTPYQNYVDRGYFRLIESKYTKPDGSTHINLKTVVYQKGLDFIRKSVELSV